MNILTLDHISKNYIGRMLLDDASFYLAEGEKVGVIGINGTGKSTLLKIIAGLEEPDEGKVIFANNHVVSYLPQTPQFDPEDTVIDSVVKACGGHDEYGSHESDAKAMLYHLTDMMSLYPGSRDVLVYLPDGKTIRANPENRVELTEELRGKLISLLGEGNVKG